MVQPINQPAVVEALPPKTPPILNAVQRPDTPQQTERWVSKLGKWLFSSYPLTVIPDDATKALMRSFQITAHCRYSASRRISMIGFISFLTATIFSLGLIFIPLIQLSDISLGYPGRVISILDVFFAVAVLIYTVIISSARYETRAKSLNDSGDKIKELRRKLQNAISMTNPSNPTIDTSVYNGEYSRLGSLSENHGRLDYNLVILQSKEYFHITGIPRLWVNIKIFIGYLIEYFFSIVLILAEVVVILDILKVTYILTPIFS